MNTHHTNMSVRLKLDHYLQALGENIGTIGNADEVIRSLKNKWVEYEKVEDELKIHLDEHYPEGANILRAIDKAQDRIITHILEICTIIITENQKSNHAISRYDPLAKVDRLRALVEMAKRNKKQIYLFEEAKDAKRTRRIHERRAFTSYIPVASKRGMGTVYPTSASAEVISAFEE